MAMKELPPLRENPREADALDGQRIALVRGRWTAQDAYVMARDRQVEEAVRMLSGRQWDMWSDVLGRFVDVTRYMSDDEKRWRQRPQLDYLRFWFRLTLAKPTENPPIISFQPASPDRSDAMLAEVMDTVWKVLWREAEMDQNTQRLIAWMLAAGEAYLKSRIDYTQGPERELTGPAMLSLMGPDGSPIERALPNVPFGPDGSPLAQIVPEGDDPYGGYEVTGEPHKQKQGKLCVDVLGPLEVRAQWGANIPWNKKRWMIHRSYLAPEDVYERFGIEATPDMVAKDGASAGMLERMLFQGGMYGAFGHQIGGQEAGNPPEGEGFVAVDEMWEMPSQQFPEGRLCVVTQSHVLHDSARPFECEAAGPIRQAMCEYVPGRPFGSTPLEVMIPLQKRLNRIEAQIAEHTNLMTNPIMLLGDGIDDVTNAPGQRVEGGLTPDGTPLIGYASPPSLGADVWRDAAHIKEHLFIVGGIPGSEGSAPTENASGELVSQLRYNADRQVGNAAQSAVRAIGDVAQDWVPMLRTMWTDEQFITYAGEDGVARTLTVLPEMLDGSVHVEPVVESMLPEGRQERQQRVMGLYGSGMFGDPMSPEAKSHALSLARFPHLGRAVRPGGVDRVTAEQNLGRILQGAKAAELPILEQYRLGTFKDVTREFIASPEYLKLDPAIQAEFQAYYEALAVAEVVQAQGEMVRQGVVQEQAAVAQAGLQSKVQEILPPPDESGTKPPGSPPEKKKSAGGKAA